MVKLKEDISIVSPYYERNKKGETGYLSRDACKFTHTINLEIYCGGFKYVIGVHEGTVEGVKLFFLHNPNIFPSIYADGDAQFTLRQLSVFAKVDFLFINKLFNLFSKGNT